jgi:isovaleryl-CoA dehydrogenase
VPTNCLGASRRAKKIWPSADVEIAPRAAEIDRANEFPADLWKKLGDLGVHGMTVSEEYGGTDMGYLAHIVAMEEISRASASVGLSYGAHSNLCINQIRRNGTEAQKQKYLPKLISGDHVGALAMSEPNAGSDVVSMKLRADRKGDRFILNGSKMWITNGGDADTLVVYAKTDVAAGPKGITAFIIEKGMKGFSHGTHLDKLGMRGSNTFPLFFDDCRGAGGERARRRGQHRPRRAGADERPGLRARGALRRPARHHGGVHGRGRALSARAQAVRHPDRRVPAHAGQARRHVLHLEACRAYAYAVGQACDRGDHARTLRKDAAGVILYTAEKATWMAGEAIQTLGGVGYTNEYPTGRLWRDAKLYEIGAGTSEIRRMLIGRELCTWPPCSRTSLTRRSYTRATPSPSERACWSCARRCCASATSSTTPRPARWPRPANSPWSASIRRRADRAPFRRSAPRRRARS